MKKIKIQDSVLQVKDKAVKTLIKRCETGESSSGGGTTDYADLTDKPSIESVELSGNKTADDLGLALKTDLDSKQDKLTNTTGTEKVVGLDEDSNVVLKDLPENFVWVDVTNDELTAKLLPASKVNQILDNEGHVGLRWCNSTSYGPTRGTDYIYFTLIKKTTFDTNWIFHSTKYDLGDPNNPYKLFADMEINISVARDTVGLLNKVQEERISYDSTPSSSRIAIIDDTHVLHPISTPDKMRDDGNGLYRFLPVQFRRYGTYQHEWFDISNPSTETTDKVLVNKPGNVFETRAIDTAPVKNSTNLITSGAVVTYHHHITIQADDLQVFVDLDNKHETAITSVDILANQIGNAKYTGFGADDKIYGVSATKIDRHVLNETIDKLYTECTTLIISDTVSEI